MQPAFPTEGPGGAAPPAPGFLGRRWPWLLPLGCAGLLFALAVFVTAVLGIVGVSMRSSDVYREAMARASADGAVIAELGLPIESGLLITGSLRVSGHSGSAELTIPISGPRNGGTLYLSAAKSAGRWTFSTLEVEVDGSGARIPLLPAPATAP